MIAKHATINENTYVLLKIGYIAVQTNGGIGGEKIQMAKQLDIIAHRTSKLIVFFCAGTAPSKLLF